MKIKIRKQIFFMLILLGLFFSVSTISATVTWSTVSDGFGGTYSLCTATGSETAQTIYNADTGGSGHQNLTKIGNKLFYPLKDVYYNFGDGSTPTFIDFTGYTFLTRTVTGGFGLGLWMRDIFDLKTGATWNLTLTALTMDHTSTVGTSYPIHMRTGSNLTINQSRVDDEVTDTTNLVTIYADSATTCNINMIHGGQIINGQISYGNVNMTNGSALLNGILGFYFSNIYLDNAYFYNVNSPFSSSQLTYANNIEMDSCLYGVGLIYYDILMRNIVLKKNQYLGQQIGTGTSHYELRDSKSDSWILQGSNVNNWVNNTNSFDMTTTPGATVAIKNVTGYQVYTGILSDGLLPTQHLINLTIHNGVVNYWSPYNLSIALPGYKTNYYEFYMNESRNWQTMLAYNATPNIEINQNLIDCSGSFAYSWSPMLYKLTGWANYTSTKSGTQWFILSNPNPANSSTIYDTNRLTQNDDGITLSVDISFMNATPITEAALGPGSIYAANEYTSTTSRDNIGENWGTICQTFNVTAENHLNKLSLIMNRTLSSFGSVECGIAINDTKNFSVPFDENLFISTGNINLADITTAASGSWANISMSPCVLKTGVQYIFLIRHPQYVYDTNVVLVNWTSTNTYPDGQLIVIFCISGNCTYQHFDKDMTFRVYGWQEGVDIAKEHIVNVSFYDNASGTWVLRHYENITTNQTVSYLDPYLSGDDREYNWNVTTAYYNETNVLCYENKSYVFKVSSSPSSLVSQGLVLGCIGAFAVLFPKKKKRKDNH